MCAGAAGNAQCQRQQLGWLLVAVVHALARRMIWRGMSMPEPVDLNAFTCPAHVAVAHA